MFSNDKQEIVSYGIPLLFLVINKYNLKKLMRGDFK